MWTAATQAENSRSALTLNRRYDVARPWPTPLVSSSFRVHPPSARQPNPSNELREPAPSFFGNPFPMSPARHDHAALQCYVRASVTSVARPWHVYCFHLNLRFQTHPCSSGLDSPARQGRSASTCLTYIPNLVPLMHQAAVGLHWFARPRCADHNHH